MSQFLLRASKNVLAYILVLCTVKSQFLLRASKNQGDLSLARSMRICKGVPFWLMIFSLKVDLGDGNRMNGVFMKVVCDSTFEIH